MTNPPPLTLAGGALSAASRTRLLLVFIISLCAITALSTVTYLSNIRQVHHHHGVSQDHGVSKQPEDLVLTEETRVSNQLEELSKATTSSPTLLCPRNGVPVQLGGGSWTSDNSTFTPDHCSYHIFSRSEIMQCLSSRSAIFIGDSLLRNALQGFLTLAKDDFKFEKSMIDNQHVSLGDGATVDFLWHPSSRFQVGYKLDNVLQLRNSNSVHVVSSQAIWDMHNYNAGPVAYQRDIHNTMNTYQEAKKANKIQAWAWFKLHTLHPARCEDQNNIPCTVCNRPDRQELYRRAVERAMCMVDGGSMDFIDTAYMTSLVAEESHDGVHYSDRVSRMQGMAILNWLCHDIIPAGTSDAPSKTREEVCAANVAVHATEDSKDRTSYTKCYP